MTIVLYTSANTAKQITRGKTGFSLPSILHQASARSSAGTATLSSVRAKLTEQLPVALCVRVCVCSCRVAAVCTVTIPQAVSATICLLAALSHRQKRESAIFKGLQPASFRWQIQPPEGKYPTPGGGWMPHGALVKLPQAFREEHNVSIHFLQVLEKKLSEFQVC